MPCVANQLFSFLAPHLGDGGLCGENLSESDKQKILSELNNALPLLMKRLDAKGTIWYWTVPVYGGIFALPQDCLEVRQAWLDGKAVEQRDEWFLGRLGMDQCANGLACDGANLIDLGDGYALPYRWPDIHFDARFGLMAEHDGDAGKEVQVELKDRYGATQREMLVLKSDQLLTVSEHAVTDILFTRKPITNGAVRRYIYYPQTNARVFLDSLPPALQNVSYRKKQLPHYFRHCNGTLKIKGKLRFQPLVSEYDPLPICDAPALGFAFRALAAMRRGENGLYNESLTLAVNEAQRELQDSRSNGITVQMAYKSGFNRQVGSKCWL